MHPASGSRRSRRCSYTWAIASLLVISLAACSPMGPTPQVSVPEQAVNHDLSGNHPPEILQVVERQEIHDGYRWIYYDVYFIDQDGDAEEMVYDVLSSTLPFPLELDNAPLATPSQDPGGEALFTETAKCWQKVELAYQGRIRDRAGNLSEPVSFQLSCPAPAPFDTRPFLITGLATALAVGLALLAGFWLLFRKQPEQRMPALRSTVLLTFLFMIARFCQLIFHEGGHALYTALKGVPTVLYVHPFLFRGFSRPILIGSSAWYDALGSGVSLLGGLLVFLLSWKKRSPALLPIAALFPYIALLDGFNIMGFMGDFRNLVVSTGLPAAPFLILGTAIFCLGLITLFSLLPLAGLDPDGHQAIFILPAALFLASSISFLVEHLVVLPSAIHQEYFMGWEILSDNHFVFWVGFAILLAALYIILFRRLYPRLPAWLRSDTVQPTWKDLRLPGLIWVLSLILGLAIISWPIR